MNFSMNNVKEKKMKPKSYWDDAYIKFFLILTSKNFEDARNKPQMTNLIF